MLAFSFDWQHGRTSFVIDDDSPLDIANALTGDIYVKSLTVLDNVFSMCGILLADALLVCGGLKI